MRRAVEQAEQRPRAHAHVTAAAVMHSAVRAAFEMTRLAREPTAALRARHVRRHQRREEQRLPESLGCRRLTRRDGANAMHDRRREPERRPRRSAEVDPGVEERIRAEHPRPHESDVAASRDAGIRGANARPHRIAQSALAPFHIEPRFARVADEREPDAARARREPSDFWRDDAELRRIQREQPFDVPSRVEPVQVRKGIDVSECLVPPIQRVIFDAPRGDEELVSALCQ